MTEAFNFIPEIGKRVKKVTEKKELTSAEEQELERLKARMKELNPRGSGAGKRAEKRNEAMAHLIKLSEMNKELKAVDWMNSKKSAMMKIKSDPTKYGGWTADNSRDISGDGIPDVIIYDQHGAVRGVNGNTIKKSKYPERNMYVRSFPDPQQRRAKRDKDGKPMNYAVDEEGRKISGSEQYVTKKKYIDDHINKLNVDALSGEVEYASEYTKKTKKLTPFKIFSKVVMSNYWEALINNGYMNDIPKHLKAMFYLKLKKNTWEYIKHWAASKILGIEYPADKAKREYIDKTPKMKNALDQLMKEIIVTPIEDTGAKLNDAYMFTRHEVLSQEAAALEGKIFDYPEVMDDGVDEGDYQEDAGIDLNDESYDQYFNK